MSVCSLLCSGAVPNNYPQLQLQSAGSMHVAFRNLCEWVLIQDQWLFFIQHRSEETSLTIKHKNGLVKKSTWFCDTLVQRFSVNPGNFNRGDEVSGGDSWVSITLFASSDLGLVLWFQRGFINTGPSQLKHTGDFHQDVENSDFCFIEVSQQTKTLIKCSRNIRGEESLLRCGPSSVQFSQFTDR